MSASQSAAARSRQRAQAALIFVALVFLSACSTGGAADRILGRKSLAIFHTADIHSHLFESPLAIGGDDAARGLGPEGQTVSVGGAARLGTVLEEGRASAERSVYLDAGDILEGTAVYNLFHGVPELEVLDVLGVDAMAIGNHDLDAGDDALRNLETHFAKFPLVAANLVPELSTGLAVPTALIERGGVTVGVIGLGHSADDAPDVATSAAAVTAAIDRIRTKADVVVVVSHLGSDVDRALVPKTTGIDVLLGGHTHDVLEPEPVLDCDGETADRYGCHPRSVPVVHPGAYGQYLGRVDLVVSNLPEDLERGDPRAPSAVLDTQCSLVPVNGSVPERSDVTKLLQPYHDALVQAGFERPFAFAPETVFRTATSGGDSALGNYVTSALRQSVGADVAFVNTTGIRADVPEGTVTLDDMYRVLPFDDEVVTFEATGKDLASALSVIAKSSCSRGETQIELDGGTVVFDCSGKGTASASIGGQALDEDATYRVVTIAFLADSGGWFDFSDAPIRHSGVELRDVVLGRVRRSQSCSPQPALPCIDARAGAAADGRISMAHAGGG